MFHSFHFHPDLSAPLQALLTLRSTGCPWPAWKRTAAELLCCLSPLPWTCCTSSLRWTGVCVCRKERHTEKVCEQNVFSTGCIVIECIDFPGLIIEPCFSPLCSSNNLENGVEFILQALNQIREPKLTDPFHTCMKAYVQILILWFFMKKLNKSLKMAPIPSPWLKIPEYMMKC